jgi:hypothetical protein
MEEAVAAAPGGPLRRCAIANAQPQRQRRSVTGFGWERLRGEYSTWQELEILHTRNHNTQFAKRKV